MDSSPRNENPVIKYLPTSFNTHCFIQNSKGADNALFHTIKVDGDHSIQALKQIKHQSIDILV